MIHGYMSCTGVNLTVQIIAGELSIITVAASLPLYSSHKLSYSAVTELQHI